MFLIVLVFSVWSVMANTANHDDIAIHEEWIRPDPWSIYEHEMQKVSANKLEGSRCPPVSTCPLGPQLNPADKNNQLALTNYKKFMLRLLPEDALVPEANSVYLLYNLQLKVKRDQLEELKNADTARKIDEIAASIFEQSDENVHFPVAGPRSLNEGVPKMGENLLIRYLIIVLVSLVLYNGQFHSRRHVIRWCGTALILCLISSAFMEYHECNKNLVADALSEMKLADSSNLCDENDDSQQQWLHSAGRIIWDPQMECRKHLLEKKGVVINTCDTTHVWAGLIAKLQPKYLQSYLQETIAIGTKIMEYLGLAEKVTIGFLILKKLGSIVLSFGLKELFKFLTAKLVLLWKRFTTAEKNHENINTGGYRPAAAATQNVTIVQHLHFGETSRVENLTSSSPQNPESAESDNVLPEDASGDTSHDKDASESTNPEGNIKITKDKPVEVDEKKPGDNN